MQNFHQENWDLFRKMMFEQLDKVDLEDFEYNADVLDRKVDEGEYSLEEVRGLYVYRAMNGEGFGIGHKLCRRHLALLRARFKTQHEDMSDG